MMKTVRCVTVVATLLFRSKTRRPAASKSIELVDFVSKGSDACRKKYLFVLRPANRKYKRLFLASKYNLKKIVYTKASGSITIVVSFFFILAIFHACEVNYSYLSLTLLPIPNHIPNHSTYPHIIPNKLNPFLLWRLLLYRSTFSLISPIYSTISSFFPLSFSRLCLSLLSFILCIFISNTLQLRSTTPHPPQRSRFLNFNFDCLFHF